MLFVLLVVTLALLATAIAGPKAWAAPTAFWVHLVLAAGVMGLITAAMQHFVPVLCRSRGTGLWMSRLPLLMLAAGGLAALTLLGLFPYAVVSPAALLGVAGVAAMLVWMRGKARAALGGPHPGLAWYVAAMACLAAGLAAIALAPFLPQWHAALRAFHLHINLYGFIGLTAVGTLQVLMPTVAERPDPQAGLRLRTDLKWAVAGSLLLAAGQAVEVRGLAWAGAALWAWVLGRMGLAWLRLHGRQVFALHGAAPALAAALLGLASAMAGTLGVGMTLSTVSTFLPAFLFPLITGTATQLAPVWLRPSDLAWQEDSRRTLGRWGGLRAILFLFAAVLPLLGYKCAGMPALLALFWFGIPFVIWLMRD